MDGIFCPGDEAQRICVAFMAAYPVEGAALCYFFGIYRHRGYTCTIAAECALKAMALQGKDASIP